MSKTKMVLLRIAGSVLGLLVGGIACPLTVCLLVLSLCWATYLLGMDLGGQSSAGSSGDDIGYSGVAILIGGACVVVGAAVGSAAGATVAQRILRQRGSFWKGLLGSVTGLLFGGCIVYIMYDLEVSMSAECWEAAIASISALMAVGAVVGSSWKARKADSP